MKPGQRVYARRQVPYQLQRAKPDEWYAIHAGEQGEVVKDVSSTAAWCRFPGHPLVLCPKRHIKRIRDERPRGSYL